MFLFNIGGVVELGQSLIQVYENRLGSFDQNLNQKHDYVSFLDFSINIPRDWISIDDNTTQYVRLIPKRLIGEHQKISAIVIGPSGTSPSFPASVYQILSGGRENVFCDGGRFKEILFAGRTAVECVSINKYESIRIIRILDTSGLSNWKKNNFIFYNLQEPHLNLTSLYNKVLNTITFN
jgi:hypothetical protein